MAQRTAAAASRHASDQPTLGLDWERGDPASTLGELGLDWTRDLGDYAEYEAWLPALPGYPEMGDEDSEVYVAPIGDEYTFWMEIAPMESQLVKLTDMDFNLPHAKTADEMMQEVDSLTIQDILDALTAIGWEPDPAWVAKENAKEGKHMIRKATKRTAALDLDWMRDYEWNEWYANLPAIPGYPWIHSQIDVVPVGDGYGFEIIMVDADDLLSANVAPIHLYNDDFGIPDTDTAEEMMDIVEERLTPEMIADALQAKGYTPGGIATAARHASRRIASLDLDWQEDETAMGDTMYVAELPEIPGYPYSGNSNSTVLLVPSTFNPGEYLWFMDIRVSEDTTVRLSDYELTGMGSYPLDYQMGYLDGLSVEWIADKLAEKGYMPDED